MKKVKKGLICASVGVKDQDIALEKAQNAAKDADVIEIRLDHLLSSSVRLFTESLAIPLLFTNRAKWEGGEWKGGEDERIGLLEEAVDVNAAFIDLEILAPSQSHNRLQKSLERSSTQLVLSWHNFNSTPKRSELLELLKSMRHKGADIGKIVTTAHTYKDVLRVLRLQEDAAEMDLPLIAFCMGQAGIISRIATLELGGFMTYCSLDEGEATAPGQISTSLLRDVYSRTGIA